MDMGMVTKKQESLINPNFFNHNLMKAKIFKQDF